MRFMGEIIVQIVNIRKTRIIQIINKERTIL